MSDGATSVGGPRNEVVVVRYGTRIGHRSQVFLNYEIYREADAPIAMDYFFWVVRGGERTVLVDTGFSQVGGIEHRERTYVIDPAEAYGALGIDVSAPIDLVVSHAHYDHIGNLDLFPAATVHIARSEYAFWTGAQAERAQFAWSTESAEIDALRRAEQEGRLRLVDERATIAAGIEMEVVGGHTPGQSIVTVSTAAGPVLIASDAVHYYEELERDLPFAFVADLPAMYAGFDTVRRRVEETGAVLVTGHDPSTLERFGAMTDGPLAGLAAVVTGSITGNEEEIA